MMGKWHKVEEELPTEEDMYITYGVDGLTMRPFNVYHNCWDDSDGDDYFCDAVGGRITHWMEAPNRPS